MRLCMNKIPIYPHKRQKKTEECAIVRVVISPHLLLHRKLSHLCASAKTTVEVITHNAAVLVLFTYASTRH